MDRNAVEPTTAPQGVERHPGTPRRLHPISRAKKRSQTTPTGHTLYVLEGRFLVDEEFASTETPVYLTAVSLNTKGGGPRCRILVKGRSGRYVHTWQARKKIGPLTLSRIEPGHDAHDSLRAYLGSPQIPCDARTSVRLAIAFIGLLGESNNPNLQILKLANKTS